MVNNYNISNIGSGSRTTTGIVPLSGTAAVGAATPSGVVDTSNTDWIAFACTITGSATAQVETSFDNGTTWSAVYVIKGVDSTTTATVTASGLYFGNSIGAQSRINVTAVTGTFAVTGGTTDVTNAPNGTPSNVNVASGTVTNNPASSSNYTANTAATTNAASIKASAGNLAASAISNLTAATIYVKLYNKASAPTVGTDVPIITIPVAAAATAITEYGDEGIRFPTGLAIAVTGAAADTDTTAVAAGAHVVVAYS